MVDTINANAIKVLRVACKTADVHALRNLRGNKEIFGTRSAIERCSLIVEGLIHNERNEVAARFLRGERTYKYPNGLGRDELVAMEIAEHRLWLSMADEYIKNAEFFEAAEIYKRRISTSESIEGIERLASLTKLIGLLEQSAKIQLLLDNRYEAAQLFRQAGKVGDAAEAYFSGIAGMLKDPAMDNIPIENRIHLTEWILMALASEGQAAKGVGYSEKILNSVWLEDAILSFPFRAESVIRRIAMNAEACDEYMTALRMYRRIGDTKKAGEMHAARGDFTSALALIGE